MSQSCPGQSSPRGSTQAPQLAAPLAVDTTSSASGLLQTPVLSVCVLRPGRGCISNNVSQNSNIECHDPLCHPSTLDRDIRRPCKEKEKENRCPPHSAYMKQCRRALGTAPTNTAAAQVGALRGISFAQRRRGRFSVAAVPSSGGEEQELPSCYRSVSRLLFPDFPFPPLPNTGTSERC